MLVDRSKCCCHDDDPAACMRSRCGPSEDYDGRQEECSCACHNDYGRACADCGAEYWECVCEEVPDGQ